MSGATVPTVRDLIDAARRHGQPVPVLLALTVLVQTLRALAAARRDGSPRAVAPRDLLLRGAPLDGLLRDATRDPGIVLSPEAPETRGEEDVHAAGAVFHELLLGSPPGTPADAPRRELPTPVARLLRGLLTPDRATRLRLAQALDEARSLGLERLAEWDGARRRPRLEAGLRDALELRHEPQVRRLSGELAEIAPDCALVGSARRWLEIRSRAARRRSEARRRLAAAIYAERRRDVELWGTELRHALGTEGDGDPDLDLARHWLEEHDKRETRRRQEARKVTLKLLVTGAPLIFATLLSGLLAVVMLFGG